MYLTAQRVRSRDRKREGINVFVYAHDVGPPEIDWEKADIRQIAEGNPGTLILELIGLPPGTNDVTSYLDVVAPDGKRSSEIADAIQKGATLFPGSPDDALVWAADFIRLRYFANAAAHPDAASEFQRLKDKLLLVLGSGLATGRQTARVVRAPNPLRIVSQKDEAGVRYFLDDASRQVLRRARPDLHVAHSLGVSHGNGADLGRMYGDVMYREFAIALTGLNLNQIRALAGVVVLSPDGRALWGSDA